MSAGIAVALEREYQQAWCDEHAGRMEVRLTDGARVDCVTKNYAIEVDYAHKWAEAIGQSLYYGIMLGKRPGVLLIVGPNDKDFVQRLKTTAKANGIRVWYTARRDDD